MKWSRTLVCHHSFPSLLGNTTIYEVLYEAIVEVHKYNQIENDQYFLSFLFISRDILSLQDFNSFSKDPQADPGIRFEGSRRI